MNLLKPILIFLHCELGHICKMTLAVNVYLSHLNTVSSDRLAIFIRFR